MPLFTAIKHHRLTIILVTLVAMVLGLVLTFVQPMEYRSSFSVLIIDQENTLDGYSAAKSAERLSQSLAQVVYTADFSSKVAQQLKANNSAATSELFSTDEQQRRQAWKRHVDVRTLPDVGMVKFSVYDVNADRAQAVANGLSVTVVGLARDYLGGSKNVQLKIVDFPLVSKHPVRPNVAINLIASAALGFLVAAAFAVARPLMAALDPMAEEVMAVEPQSPSRPMAMSMPMSVPMPKAPPVPAPPQPQTPQTAPPPAGLPRLRLP